MIASNITELRFGVGHVDKCTTQFLEISFGSWPFSAREPATSACSILDSVHCTYRYYVGHLGYCHTTRRKEAGEGVALLGDLYLTLCVDLVSCGGVDGDLNCFTVYLGSITRGRGLCLVCQLVLPH